MTSVLFTLGRYAPWLVMHDWDIVNLQLYESWSPADHFLVRVRVRVRA